MRRYEAARDALAGTMREVELLADAGSKEAIVAARTRLERGKFVLAVVGEFSSGKSFLLNALLGKFWYEQAGNAKRIAGLLATDINPSTAAITELDFGEQDEAYAHYSGGRTERVALDRLSRFISVGRGETGKLHDATQEQRDVPERVMVRVDSPFLQRGFTIADTPGLASVNPAHRRATLQFLPSADAVLYLIDTQQPFTEGDASFLGIIRGHLDSIFIVQTKIDLWESVQDDGRADWEHARDRIAALAAVHAPGTYVYALSALSFVRGILEESPALVAQSRFDLFVNALDASLIATTGRARLRRAYDQSAVILDHVVARLQADVEMLSRDTAELEQAEASARPQIEALEQNLRIQSNGVAGRAAARRQHAAEQADVLCREMQAELTQALDTADIARVRDRARLNILIDRLFLEVVGEFATRLSAEALNDIRQAQHAARQEAALRFSLNDAAAVAFGAQGASGLWSSDVDAAVAASIVLEAIAGPGTNLVSDIGARFAGKPSGAYMKRELTADLRSEILPHMRADLMAFTTDVAVQLETIASSFCSALQEVTRQMRDIQLGSIERSRAAHQRGDVAQLREELAKTVQTLGEKREQMRRTAKSFFEREPEIAAADAGPHIVRRAHDQASFDRQAYGKGLRPTRWRVAVLGALRRGKSSLINAIAGSRVLADEVAGAIAFPVHVRYGPAERAYALAPSGVWNEVEIESALEEATRNPVLIETPWKLPRELVLVHVPAFDSGAQHAEEIALVAASNASEMLCLFSRQLSDRELDLFERVAAQERPMQFVHTIADNETPAERRGVVELAKEYLAQRKISPKRVFTVSILEYAQAKRDGRAPAGWNELDALVATLSADSEAHMQRLERLERAAAASTANSVHAVTITQPNNFISRLLGRKSKP